MKNKKFKALALGVAAVSAFTVMGFTACGGNGGNGGDNSGAGTEKSYEEQVVEYLTSYNQVTVDGTNVYASTYDEMVSYLREEGIITCDDADKIDINTTAGYVKDNTQGGTFNNAFKVADKAYDFDGVWLLWWDVQNGSKTYSYYSSYGSNVQIGGGAQSMPLAAKSGYFAINTKEIADLMNESWDWSKEEGDEGYISYDDWTEQHEADLEEALANSDVVAAFTGIDDTRVNFTQYSIAEIATLLRTGGFLTASDIVAATDLNTASEYSFIAETRDWVDLGGSWGWSDYYNKTYKVAYANSAAKYGKISIYYYNTVDGDFDTYTFAPMYTSLAATKTTNVYYGQDNLLADKETPETSLYKYDDDKMYSESGTQLTFSVEYVIGNIALIIDD